MAVFDRTILDPRLVEGPLGYNETHTLVLLLLGFLPTLLQPHPGFRRRSRDGIGHAEPVRASRII